MTTGSIFIADIHQMWAAGPGALVDHLSQYPYAPNNRTKPANQTDNNQIRPATPYSITCVNCHRGHNADSSAGALILMRGTYPVTATTSIGYATVPTSASGAWAGLLRMHDLGGRGMSINNTNPLCLACHK